MKIQNVRFQNINSLKGQWEIAFDRSPLADAGIFAITGPNGAGKTSILDSLTLALYGQTPRLKNPGEEIITRNCSESSSEVIFSVNDAMYRSQWHIRRKNGKAELPEMKLFSLNGQETLLDEKPGAVRSRIAELTGLDFRRFCRSVMLAQGEFAAFLHALDSERSEILEKIIGPEIRSEYTRQTFQKVESENEKLARLKEEVSNFSLPDSSAVRQSEDMLLLIQEQLTRVQNQLDAEQEELAVLIRENERFANMERLRKNYENARVSLAEVLTRQEGMQEEFRKLDRAGKAEPIQADRKALDALEARRESAGKNIAELASRIPILEERLDSLRCQKEQNEKELEQIRQKLADQKDAIEKALSIKQAMEDGAEGFRRRSERYKILEKEQNRNLQEQNELKNRIAENETALKETEKWLADRAADAELGTDIPIIRTMYGELGGIRLELDKARNRHSESLKAEARISKIIKKTEQALAHIREKREQILSKVQEKENENRELMGEGSLQDMESLYKNLRTKRRTAKKLLGLSKNYSRQMAGNREKYERIEAELKESGQKYEELAQKLSQEENIRVTLGITLKYAIGALKYTSERASLKADEPCPLCGSTSHPYADGLPWEGDPKKALRDQENRVRTVRNEMNFLSEHRENLRKQISKRTALLEEWEKFSGAIHENWSPEDAQKIENAIAELKDAIRKQELRIKTVEKNRKKADKYEKAARKKENKISKKQLVLDNLHNDLTFQQDITAGLAAEMEEIQKREQHQTEALREKAKKYGEDIPAPGKKDILLPVLEKRRNIFLLQMQKLENVKKVAADLEKRAESLPQALILLKKEADELETQIRTVQEGFSELKNRQEEMFGSQDPLQVKQELEKQIHSKTLEIAQNAQKTEAAERDLAALRQKTEQAQAEYEKIGQEKKNREQAIIARSLGAGFSSLEEMANSLLQPAEQERIQKQRREMEQKVAESRAKLESIRNMLEAQPDVEQPEQSPEIIRVKIQETRKERDRLTAEFNEVEKTIKKYQSLEQEYALKTKELEEQEKLCAPLNSLKSLMESGNEPEIRKQIQNFMLNRLLEKSNRHMEELSGHYYIRRTDPFGMSLEVEDIRHKGMRRPVKTLSGGESFVASLSLALGLSEMACSDRKIESLFLDEGFGMLDEETLYKVVSSLKNIKARGKMVGVISHVKRLEDEIRTQIKINRLPDGASRIEIVA